VVLGGRPARLRRNSAGPVGKGSGRSTRSPGSRWALGFGRRGGRRAAHRQLAVAAAAAARFPARAARWGGGARRRATTSAREGDRRFSWGKPPVGLDARRGGLSWRQQTERCAAGRVVSVCEMHGAAGFKGGEGNRAATARDTPP
jgi:hypothetical protein